MSKPLKIFLIIIGIFALAVAAGAAFFIIDWRQNTKLTVQDVLNQTLENRQQAESEPSPFSTSTFKLPASSTGTINILLLGLDHRKTSTSSRCDAIHMITINTQDWSAHITSMPRGTRTAIPGLASTSTQSYVANACGMVSVNYGIKQIERMLKIKADYVIKVGFSQTLGLLRLFKLPTNESLQWLRDRKSFGIGDPQRSHNQAVFIKDVALKKIALFTEPSMYPVAKVAYSFVDTNLDFPSFYALIRGFAESDIAKHPEKITLSMWPIFYTPDYHFNFNNPTDFVTSMKATIPTSSLTEQNYQAIQAGLIKYIKNRLTYRYSIKDIVEKQLWLQIEDEAERESLHYEIVKRQIKEARSLESKTAILEEYIFEKETLGLTDYVQKGQALLLEVTSTTPKL